MPVNDQTPDVTLFDANGVEMSVANGIATPIGTRALLAAAVDSTGVTRFLQAAIDGRLITSSLPTPPAGTTAVRRFADGAVGANNVIETIYTITATKTLVIQLFGGGGGGGPGDARVELVSRPTGLPASDTVIDVGYVDGNNFQFSLAASFLGDGAAQIVVKRINSGGGPERIAGKWSGYEQ